MPRVRAVVADATCSARIIAPFAKCLAQTGHDAEALLERYGLSIDAVRDRDLRLPHREAMAFIRDAIATSGDPAIGVHAAACEQAGDFDVIEYAAANCPTLGEAMRLAARFIALMHDGISLEIESSPPLAAMRVRVAPGLDVEPAGIEFLFASLIAHGGRFIGRRTRPIRVELAHPGPVDATPYRDAFRDVRFDAPAHVMWFHALALDVPHVGHDRSLLQILMSHADDLLRQLGPPCRSFGDRVRQAIAEELSGNPGAEHVARKLAVSVRTLHRRLAEEETSHGELLDDVRRTQAVLHLGGARFSIGEISFLLGFAHPNAFHKAFKRWTGMTPAQYRAVARSDGRSARME